MSFLGTMASMLDKLTGSGSTRVAVNRFLSDYGSLNRLDIDRTNKRIKAQFQLRGEIFPINIEILSYELRGSAIIVKGAKADKPWAQSIINNFLLNKEVSLPEDYMDVIQEIL